MTTNHLDTGMQPTFSIHQYTSDILSNITNYRILCQELVKMATTAADIT
jgi:hypothetical protein